MGVKGVWINGVVYSGITSLSQSLVSKALSHPTEDGFVVSDHMTHNPIQFSLNMILGGDSDGDDREEAYHDLVALRNNGEPFEFICEFGMFEQMVITSLSPALERTLNTYSCQLAIEQVNIASIEEKDFEVVDSDGEPVYSQERPQGEAPVVSPSDEGGEDVPEIEKSWAKSALDWVVTNVMALTASLKDE
jgi:hypothetical protein